MYLFKQLSRFLLISLIFVGIGLFQEVFEFNNCGKTGYTGPSQSQCDGAYLGTTLDGEVSVNSGIQEWMVPHAGNYIIEARGAKGGRSTNRMD